jgi:hypothetical protein
MNSTPLAGTKLPDIEAVSTSNREQKLGSFCEILALSASCTLDLILALREAANRAVSARCGTAVELGARLH